MVRWTISRNVSYVSRVLRLTLLAPEIVEALLDGRQPLELSLAAPMRPFSVAWADQKALAAKTRALAI